MDKKTQILLVEDEESLAIGLEYNLNAEGYEVTWVMDGKEALKGTRNKEYDLVILDIMLPYVDGFEVARQIREQYPQLPILMLTARTELKDKLKGLETGADDYMTKPFHLEELLLRVKGMLKRKEWYVKSLDHLPYYKFGKNEINFQKLTAQCGTDEINLTAHEAMLIKFLIENKGKVLSRKEILENVWQIYSDIETRTVDNFIARLRKYFEQNPENPQFIKSVRGVGYIFDEN